MQRGEMDVSTPGSESCYRKVGPCGGAPSGIVSVLQGGSRFTVHFQQNLNHFYVPNPGYLDASIAVGSNPAEGDFRPFGDSAISDFNAMNMITQTNFTITGTVPNIDCPACTFRVRYVSNNPLENDRGEIFYQCGDIRIQQNKSPIPILPPSGFGNIDKQPGDGQSCCVTEQQWLMNAYESGSYRNPTQMVIAYDSVNKLMRVDTNSGGGVTIYDGTFIMFLNFTSGIEYYVNVNKGGECSAYGLDYWNDWCYGGVSQKETFVESVTVGGARCDVWGNDDFHFINSQEGCSPVLLQRNDGSVTIYYNLVPYNDSSIFVPPSNCHTAEVRGKAPKEHYQMLHPSMRHE